MAMEKHGDMSLSSLSPSPIKLNSLDSNNDNDGPHEDGDGSMFYHLQTSLDYGPGIDDMSDTFDDMMHDDSTLNYSRVEPQIAAAKNAILKRDEIIKKLVDSYEMVKKNLDERDEELRKEVEEKNEIERKTCLLDERFQRLGGLVQFIIMNNPEIVRKKTSHDTDLGDLSNFGDISSFLNLPEPTLPFLPSVVSKLNSNHDHDHEFHNSESVPSSPLPNCNSSQEIEDLKLQVADLDKKLETNCKYLEEITTERENERDDYIREIEHMEKRFADQTKEKERLEDINLHQKIELEDYETRLKDADEVEQELVGKSEKAEEELRTAVDKIYELREIIRDLEQQIDSASVNANELKEHNQFLTADLERLENKFKEQGDLMQTTQDTITSGVQDVAIDEIQLQINDLTVKLEKKLIDMDNFPWSTRPNSSCSGTQYLSTEDISVKELSSLSRTMQAANPQLVAEGLCRLETHFESLVRFEEIIMKKMKDNEMRYGLAKKRQEELENEKLALQETIKEQILKISDLQSRLDQLRFEPSPNAVTLSGLRARVQFLSEEVEEYKGKLQLKFIEYQDVEHKLASAQALLSKYTSPNIRKASAIIQTEHEVQKHMSVQTEPIKMPRQNSLKSKEVSVQTSTAQPTQPVLEDYHLDLLELSSIQGGPAPTHSTPNEPVTDLIRRKKPVSWTSEIDFRGSPEVMRFRENEVLHQSVLSGPGAGLSDKVCTIADPPTSDNEDNVSFEQILDRNDKIELLARVQFLSEQIEEYKEQVQMKVTQNQNTEQKLATAETLLSKYAAQLSQPKPKTTFATVQTELQEIKNSSVQTELDAIQNSSAQTESAKLCTIAIQTGSSLVELENIELQARVQVLSEQVQEYRGQLKLQLIEKQDVDRNLAATQALLSKYIAQLQQFNVKKASVSVQSDREALRNSSMQTDLKNICTIATQAEAPPVDRAINEQVLVDTSKKTKPISWASIELYLRTKSHRKALCWQKKYLTIVIHGYKDLLCVSGAGFEHPDLLQKQLSIVPTSIGLADRNSPLTRFRIVAKVIIATSRMKFMVRRWNNKLHRGSSGGSSGSKENSPPQSLHRERTTKPMAGVHKSDYQNVLTQYLERFQTLENEIGQTMFSRNRTHPK